MTITTVDEDIRRKIEPAASPSSERIETLRKAGELGIRTYVFLGPFMPGLTDTDEALDALISAIAELPLSQIHADKLNPRPGVWNEIVPLLKRWHPELMEYYRSLFFQEDEYKAYCADLAYRLRQVAQKHGMADRLNPVF